MDITYEQILNSSLIKKAALARLMWPGIKNTTTKLDNKINERDGQRLRDEDKALIVEVFKKEFGFIS